MILAAFDGIVAPLAKNNMGSWEMNLQVNTGQNWKFWVES
jgi:hypothetical protein